MNDIEALYPTIQAIDAHNDKIATMLELVQRNQELKVHVRKLEKELCGMEQAWDDVMERERIALEQNALLEERVRELEEEARSPYEHRLVMNALDGRITIEAHNTQAIEISKNIFALVLEALKGE